VTLFNRGKTPNRALPGESEAEFQERICKASFIQGDRTSLQVDSREMPGGDMHETG
jgi:hypothetical protein